MRLRVSHRQAFQDTRASSCLFNRGMEILATRVKIILKWLKPFVVPLWASNRYLRVMSTKITYTFLYLYTDGT